MKPRTVLVTGAARGIGKAIALEFKSQGAEVIGLDKENCDLRHPIEIELTAKQIGNVDVLINNAGIGYKKEFQSYSVKEIIDVIDVNYRAAVLTTKLFLPGMLERKSGMIVNVSSFAGMFPESGLAVYSGTKAALRLFTKSLAKELNGSGVKTYLVNLGSVNTETFRSHYPEFNPKAVQDPKVVAKQVVELCSGNKPNGFSLDLIKLDLPLSKHWHCFYRMLRRALN